jgi:hypothetical protein
MKVLSGLLLFILAGVASTYAQQEAKIIAEIAASNERTIKNAPFSAEAISESVQTLADGNRIVRSSTTKLYRNSEGRFRREVNGGSGGVFSTSFSFGNGTTILDPVAGHRVLLDTLNGTARVATLASGQNVTIARGGVSGQREAEMARKLATAQTLTEAQRAEYAAKAKEYQQRVEELRASTPVAAGSGGVAVFSGDGLAFATTSGGGKYETRTEELGTRDFEGVSAEGTRRVTIIPAGAIGNEREIEIVYERWYSKELGLVVYSKNSDPRFGEQTYRITNLVRAEPDPSLFTVPNSYRILAEPAPVYRVTTKPSPAQSAVSPRPAAVRTTQVSNVKASKP